MADDGENTGVATSNGDHYSKKKDVSLAGQLPNNPLIKAVHDLRKQVSLPPLGNEENIDMAQENHDSIKERSSRRDGRIVDNRYGSPAADIDTSTGSDGPPPEQPAQLVAMVPTRTCCTAGARSRRDGHDDVNMTPNSGVPHVGEGTETDECEMKRPPDEGELNRSDFWSLEDVSTEGQAVIDEGSRKSHPSLGGTLSSCDVDRVAKVAVGADVSSDLSTSPSSSLDSPEEKSEEVLDRDTKCAADAAVRSVILSRPHLRPPLPTSLPDEQDMNRLVTNDRPQDAKKISISDQNVMGKQGKRLAPLMIQQSSGSGNLGDAEETSFEEEPSPSLERIGDKIGRAGLKIGDGIAALRQRGSPRSPISRKGSDISRPTLTMEDIEICQRLDEEYERALEEREVGWTARYNSVRQSACLSLTFMFVYLILGTWFFQKHTSWDIPDSLLFTIYTITTVGYGNHYLPTNPGFQMFVVFYIFVGIATLTIMVAQVYQCIALEATRAQFSRDKAEMIRRNNERAEVTGMQNDSRFDVGSRGGSTGSLEFNQQAIHNTSCSEQSFHAIVHAFEVIKHFLHYTQVGRGIAFLLPFIGLILVGALVVGSIEGWTFVESLYFSVVSLTTVGFGDYHPTEKSSIWFCIFWLPFSVGFMSLYLGSVAHFYISLSNSNIQRMERRMRRRIRRAKEAAEKERQEAYARAMAAAGQDIAVKAGGEDEASPQDIPSASPHRGGKRRSRGFATLPDSDVGDENDSNPSARGALFGSHEQIDVPWGSRRRERILQNASMDISSSSLKQSAGQTMTTMKDVLKTVRAHIRRKASRSNRDSFSSVFVGSDAMGPEVEFMSVRASNHSHRVGLNHHESHGRKPSFALRALVQERIAEIIASDIAGYQSHVEIKENTLKITIDTLKSTTDKWMIPRRARKAFRAVAFEVLYFVGEHGLITRGADALYDLTPFEFHGLFGPFLAAMGDAETMEGWLGSTDVLADVELRRDPTRTSLAKVGKDIGIPTRHLAPTESNGDGSESSGPRSKRIPHKQAKKLESVKEFHLKKASKIAPSSTHRRNTQGNAFSRNI